MTQVDKSAYDLFSYSNEPRWISYFHQLRLALAPSPKSILEIGVGDKVFGSYIRNNTGTRYVGVDFDASVSPDVVADALALPFKDGEFDLACAFEVYEHVPFERFEQALNEAARVSKKRVVISLPHFGPSIRFSFKLPFIPKIRFACKVPWPSKHVFNGQHYWEIGKKGYSIARIRSIMRKRFDIVEDFVPYGNQYHHFFVLDKKQL